MSVWDALATGTRSFQGGVNWVGNTVNQVNQLREADEANRVNQIEAAARRDQQRSATNQPQADVQQAAPTGPVQQARALQPQEPQEQQQGYYGSEATTQARGAPAPPPAGGGGAATAGGAAPAPDESWRPVLQQAMDDHRARWNGGRTGTGQPTLDQDYIRDTVTGRGQPAPSQTMAAIRHVSGNTDRPLAQNDVAAMITEGSRRMTAAGLGHRVDAWRARVMQNIQGAASRTAAVAAAQAESGDLMGAARSLSTAYGFIPDGMDVTVSQGANGQPIGQRINAQGQPFGAPIPLDAGRIREMAIAVHDPAVMENLLLQREDRAFHRAQLAETSRHNQASEANARARAAGGAGRAGGDVALSASERRTAYADVDTGLETYEADRANTRTPTLGVGQVRTIAQALAERQMPGTEAARLAAAIGRREVNPMMVGNDIGVEYHGRIITFPGPTGAIIRQYTQPPSGTGQVSTPPAGAAGPRQVARRPAADANR